MLSKLHLTSKDRNHQANIKIERSVLTRLSWLINDHHAHRTFPTQSVGKLKWKTYTKKGIFLTSFISELLCIGSIVMFYKKVKA